MTAVAITVNRHPTELSDVVLLEKYICDRGGEYFISVEQSNTKNQHCHIYWGTTKRPNNVTADIKGEKVLNILKDSSEWKVATQVKKCTTPLNWIGYVGKEMNTKLWRTNMARGVIDKCIKNYLTEEVKKPQAITTSNCVDEVCDFAYKNGLAERKVPVHIIYRLMFLSGDYAMNNFLIRTCHMKPHDLIGMKLYRKWDTHAIKSWETDESSLNKSSELTDELFAMFDKKLHSSPGV